MTTINWPSNQEYIQNYHPDTAKADPWSVPRIALPVMLLLVGLTMASCKSAKSPESTQSPVASETPTDFSLPVITPNVSPLPIETPTVPPRIIPSTPAAAPETPDIVVLPNPESVNATPSVPPVEDTPLPIPDTSKAMPLPFPKAPNPTTSKPTLANLPDGNYFYGESAEFDSPGKRYLVFTKTGNVLIGQEYLWQTEHRQCFKGIANLNNIKNVKIAYQQPSVDTEEPKWLFEEMTPLTTDSLQSLSWEKTPDFIKSNLQDCVKIFQVFNP